ncbi:hypothetical protein OPT61_g3175 [Boeremia exigua]|uniref:Uncharacterized protein n=1 Tax=Boeremia exigua TaxID=749465 RepID=A0ACC2IIY5_9PLEO|nr:hypothetical protein OPT61_g3175 [Boeremia exigua]
MEHSTTYEIVSNADTIILLKNTCMVFAEWSQSVPPDEVKMTTSALKKRRKREERALKARLASESSGNGPHEPVIDNQGLPEVETVLAAGDGGSRSLTATRLNGNSEGADQNFPESGSTTIERGESTNRDDPSSVNMIDGPGRGAVLEAIVEPQEDEGIRFQVCAGNLMSASPWFHRALKKDVWMESSRDPKDGMLRMTAEDWD